MPKKGLRESEKGKRSNKSSKAESSKRKVEYNASDTSSEIDVQDQISTMLQEFGCNMTKSLLSKQKKVKGEIEEAAEISSDEMLSIFIAHKAERQMYLNDFHAKLEEFFKQEADNLQAEKERKIQLEKQIKYQEKQLMDLMIEKEQYLETARKVSDMFFKGMEELSQNHVDNYNEMHSDINEKLKEMQKKIQVESQQQAMAKLRSNLQNLLA